MSTSKAIKFLKKAEESFNESFNKDLEVLFQSPSIAVYKGIIYGLGNDWKESIQDAIKNLREEGYTLSQVKDDISVYSASTALIHSVEEEGSEALFVVRGAKAFVPGEI